MIARDSMAGRQTVSGSREFTIFMCQEHWTNPTVNVGIFGSHAIMFAPAVLLD